VFDGGAAPQGLGRVHVVSLTGGVFRLDPADS
jgi:hypothetical protein